MSGKYAPLAPLSPDNQGSANIIVAYVLIFSTFLFWMVRFAVGRKRLLQLDVDDVTFGFAVVHSIHIYIRNATLILKQIFAIATSIVSHFEVRAGLGRHQANLSDHDVSRYFKVWKCIGIHCSR